MAYLRKNPETPTANATRPAISGQKLTPMQNNAADGMVEKLKTYAAGKTAAPAQKLDKAAPAVKTGAVEAAKPKSEFMTSSTAQDDNDMSQALKARYDAAKKPKLESMKPAAEPEVRAKMANALREKTDKKEYMAETLRKAQPLQNATGQMTSKAVDDDITAALQRAMRKRRPQ